MNFCWADMPAREHSRMVIINDRTVLRERSERPMFWGASESEIERVGETMSSSLVWGRGVG